MQTYGTSCRAKSFYTRLTIQRVIVASLRANRAIHRLSIWLCVTVAMALLLLASPAYGEPKLEPDSFGYRAAGTPADSGARSISPQTWPMRLQWELTAAGVMNVRFDGVDQSRQLTTKPTQWLQSAWLAGGGSAAEWPRFAEHYQSWLAAIKTDLTTLGLSPHEDPALCATQLLAWLHQHALKHYDENATELTQVLKSGRYNCVSATLLFQSLARECGINTVTLNRSNHCRAAIWSQGRWLPLETTCATCAPQASRQADDATLPERQLNDQAVLGLIAFNRAVDDYREGAFAAATAGNFAALQVDPDHTAARSNLTAALNAWAIAAIRTENAGQAESLLAIAAAADPTDGTTRHNQTYLNQLHDAAAR